MSARASSSTGQVSAFESLNGRKGYRRLHTLATRSSTAYSVYGINLCSGREVVPA